MIECVREIHQMTDKIIIGAGLYGLYAALTSAKKGQTVIVLEQEKNHLPEPHILIKPECIWDIIILDLWLQQ